MQCFRCALGRLAGMIGDASELTVSTKRQARSYVLLLIVAFVLCRLTARHSRCISRTVDYCDHLHCHCCNDHEPLDTHRTA